MSLLDKISIARGTDKSSIVHNYSEKYEKYLPFKRYEELNILEIGVLNGESLRVWKDWFFNSKILGIDINKECKQYEEDKITIEIGSQIDGIFLSRIVQEYDPFDLIIDDGSHINGNVIYTFEHLFNSLKSGGVYVVEDSCTSYWREYGGERYKKGSTIEYFKEKVDEVNFFGEHSEVGKYSDRRESNLIQQFYNKKYNYIGSQFESLNFLNSMILITKR